MARHAFIQDSIEHDPEYKPSKVLDHLLGVLEGPLGIFAEQIVQECYTWAKENGGLSTECDLAALKEHLGMKDDCE